MRFFLPLAFGGVPDKIMGMEDENDEMVLRRGFVHSMKRDGKSALKRKNLLALLLFFLLVGCADTKWPTWFTGEPGDDVLTAPRAVARPVPSTDDVWPNLADVSDKKPSFSQTLDLQSDAEQLYSDHLKAQAERESLQNVAMPEPMPTIESKPKEEGRTSPPMTLPASQVEPAPDATLLAPTNEEIEVPPSF